MCVCVCVCFAPLPGFHYRAAIHIFLKGYLFMIHMVFTPGLSSHFIKR